MTVPSFALMQYIERHGYLVRMIDQGLCESEEADRFRDRMDAIWKAMTPEDVRALKEFEAKDGPTFREDREATYEGLDYW